MGLHPSEEKELGIAAHHGMTLSHQRDSGRKMHRQSEEAEEVESDLSA